MEYKLTYKMVDSTWVNTHSTTGFMLLFDTIKDFFSAFVNQVFSLWSNSNTKHSDTWSYNSIALKICCSFMLAHRHGATLASNLTNTTFKVECFIFFISVLVSTNASAVDNTNWCSIMCGCNQNSEPEDAKNHCWTPSYHQIYWLMQVWTFEYHHQTSIMAPGHF